MTTTYQDTVLGSLPFTDWTVDLAQLPNGQLVALNYIQNSQSQNLVSSIMFLQPTATDVNPVTGMIHGATPSNIGTTVQINLLPVAGQSLPDIVLCDGGLDQMNNPGGSVRLLAPNASGQYVDETNQLGLTVNFNHRLSTGTIDGHAAFAIAAIGTNSGASGQVELVLANTDGTFSNWTSHLPGAVENTTLAVVQGGSNYPYTCTAIGNFADTSGDIFLGSENNAAPNVLLVNNGSGQFTKQTINVAAPVFAGNNLATDLNGGHGTTVALSALPTDFNGDGKLDVIVDYANSGSVAYGGGTNKTAAAYALQFLQGDGKGGFTDVTAQHLAVQPVLHDANGNLTYVDNVQQVSIGGKSDLILYASNGAPVLLVNDGHGVYAQSTNVLPSDIVNATWGMNDGMQGFYGYTNPYEDSYISHLVFVPVGFASADPDVMAVNEFAALTGITASATGAAGSVNLSITSVTASANIDALQQMVAANEIHSISLTDGAVPVITVTAAQLAADASAFKAIAGSFNTMVTAPTASATINSEGGLGLTVVLSGNEADYTLSSANNHLTLTGHGATYTLNGVNELQFSDASLILASQTAASGTNITSAQITELYGAVFGRVPDVGGLAYYEQTAVKFPSITFLQFAEYFLSSPEYTNNSAHSYAQNSTGDAQFITDSYKNLLGRGPEAGATQWYQTNVIDPIIKADLAAGQTMTAAELHAHAQTLVYFSQSPEFLGDVSTTGVGTPAFGGHHWLALI